MHDLEPITALGGTAARVEAHAGVTLTEVHDLALASVAARRGKEDACEGALKKLLGSTPPGPGKAVLAEPYAAVWMGPDQWMVGAPLESHKQLDEICKHAVGDAGSVTEQTDAWVCFDLAGDGLQAVIELLCPLDLRRMQSGDATRTSIHHLGCYVVVGDPQSFVRILGPRASAGSLHHALLTAMRAAL